MILEAGAWVHLYNGQLRVLHKDFFFRIGNRQYKAAINPCNIDYSAYIERRNALIVKSGAKVKSGAPIPDSRIRGLPRGEGSTFKIGDYVIHDTINDPSLGESHIGVNIKTGETRLIQKKWITDDWVRHVALKMIQTSMMLGVSV